MHSLAKICVGQIELDFVGFGIRAQCVLEVDDGLVVKAVLGKQNSNPGLSAIVIGAELIQLGDCLQSFFILAKFQVCLREQVQVLWLAWVLLDLPEQFCDVKLRAFLRREF